MSAAYHPQPRTATRPACESLTLVLSKLCSRTGLKVMENLSGFTAPYQFHERRNYIGPMDGDPRSIISDGCHSPFFFFSTKDIGRKIEDLFAGEGWCCAYAETNPNGLPLGGQERERAYYRFKDIGIII